MSGPGRSYREGITVIELFKMFPDDATADQWFEEQRWPGGERFCGDCGSLNWGACSEPQAHAIPLPGLPRILLRSQGHRHAVLEARGSEVGHRHLHDDHWAQRHV